MVPELGITKLGGGAICKRLTDERLKGFRQFFLVIPFYSLVMYMRSHGHMALMAMSSNSSSKVAADPSFLARIGSGEKRNKGGLAHAASVSSIAVDGAVERVGSCISELAWSPLYHIDRYQEMCLRMRRKINCPLPSHSHVH